ncbi:sugar phosphate isomerase/epimerase [Allokutzneria sp. A3M-2-11 16]|uniref:sugar phosphate isomerase/epimerase family protein n=1 Tax=Allokutzneria sp. A3M-2-11 16 TaxID=2962043 RepID=UPI0020B6F83E|nr:sugar phosphate isomerase/epimerase family protein [Allokutzneria sp. A3M-2-11 16]MCP3798471.1 sugar phosphate isomerase/epimerase [Allokutzneria sp. A3M-2-11 16]
MKLAVIGDEVAQDVRVVAETAAQLGLAGVEVRSFGNTPPDQMSGSQLRELRAVLDQNNLTVAGYAPPAFKHRVPVTDEEFATVREGLLRYCEHGAVLNAPHMRVFSFYRDAEPAPRTAARTVSRLLENLSLPLPLVVETGTRTNTPTVRHALDFLDELGRDDIGLLWDPGNSVFSGWDAKPFPSDYQLGGDLIRHVHVKDPDGTSGYVRLGDGDLPWIDILLRLAEDGYDGFLSLETHWRHNRSLTAAERDSPWGEDFSRGGYAASVECLQRLRRWLCQVDGRGGTG